MKGFIEWLCPHAGIIRVGPQCSKYGDPFDYAVAFQLDGKKAIIKALAADGKLTREHYRVAFDLLIEEGYFPRYERFKPGQT